VHELVHVGPRPADHGLGEVVGHADTEDDDEEEQDHPA